MIKTFADLTTGQLSSLLDALYTAEEDGVHSNPDHEEEMGALVSDLELELSNRIKPTDNYDVSEIMTANSYYNEANGWTPH